MVNARFIKPMDPAMADLARSTDRVLVVEENVRQGGFGSAFLEMLNEKDVTHPRVKRIGLPDRFIEHGSVGALRKAYGLDSAGILKEARDLCQRS